MILLWTLAKRFWRWLALLDSEPEVDDTHARDYRSLHGWREPPDS